MAATTGALDHLALPPIPDGCYTDSIEEARRQFVLGVPELLERWISRRASRHTQRAYRQDLLTFIRFAGFAWPGDAPVLFRIKVAEVHAYRDWMISRGDAPKTINRRNASLSGPARPRSGRRPQWASFQCAAGARPPKADSG